MVRMAEKIIRVSHISSLGWCQTKAKIMYRYNLEEPETDAIILGRELHKILGFAEEKEVIKPIEVNGESYLIQGHIDRVFDDFITEFKVKRGRYPLRFLIAPTHIQANLYAWLADKPKYLILILDVPSSRFISIVQYMSRVRAERDIKKAVSLFYENDSSVPTRYKWKCRVCSVRNYCFHGSEGK